MDNITNKLAELDEDIVLYDGFDDALIGYVEIFNQITACYDREKCIKILMRDRMMTEEDAEEYFAFNVTGGYVGKYTPAFLTRL